MSSIYACSVQSKKHFQPILSINKVLLSIACKVRKVSVLNIFHGKIERVLSSAYRSFSARVVNLRVPLRASDDGGSMSAQRVLRARGPDREGVPASRFLFRPLIVNRLRENKSERVKEKNEMEEVEKTVY